MKLLVIFASHRMGGVNAVIEQSMRSMSDRFDFDFLHLADHKIESCTACGGCGEAGRCVLPVSEHDAFQKIFDKMLDTDVVFIISPVYAVIPSRLTALLERMTSVLFNTGMMNTDKNPLLGKKTAIFNYCSAGICDDTPIKVIFDKFVMKNYRFDKSIYTYLNASPDPRSEYSDITAYILATLEQLDSKTTPCGIESAR